MGINRGPPDLYLGMAPVKLGFWVILNCGSDCQSDESQMAREHLIVRNLRESLPVDVINLGWSIPNVSGETLPTKQNLGDNEN